MPSKKPSASLPLRKSLDWANAPIDIDWLLDSGLLFEINRQFLHPLGIGITVRVDAQGNKTWGFKDMRATPEAIEFDKVALEMGRKKFTRFLAEFGAKQMDRRTRKRGQATQHVCPSW